MKYSVGVARCGSISQIAKAMYISQPQLSRIIKSTEKEVGFDPFQYTNRDVWLTKDGEGFLSHCQVILDKMDGLDHFINQTRQQDSRLMVLMTRFSRTMVCFNEVVCRHQDQEGLLLRLRETGTMDAVGDMVSDYSEIGVLHFSVSESESILRNSKDKRLYFQSIAHSKPYVFLSMNHKLLCGKGVRELDIRDLLSCGSARYIRQYGNFFYHTATEGGVVDLNDSAKIAYINDRMEQIGFLTRSGLYVIGIPEYPGEGMRYNVMNIPLRMTNEYLRFSTLMKESKRSADIEDEFIAGPRSRYDALSDEVEAAA